MYLYFCVQYNFLIPLNVFIPLFSLTNKHCTSHRHLTNKLGISGYIPKRFGNLTLVKEAEKQLSGKTEIGTFITISPFL